MPTYTKPSAPAADGMRLNLLEEKVRNLTPGEAPDLTAVIAGLNRLYELALRGSQHTGSQNPITYDLPDTAFWGMTEASDGTPRSIMSVTYGDTDFLARVKDVPFYQQAFGLSTGWSFVAPPLGDQDNYSLAGTVFGTPAALSDIRTREQSILGLMFGSAGTDWQDFVDAHGSIKGAMYSGFDFETDPEASTKSLLSIIRDLEQRIETRIQGLEARIENVEDQATGLRSDVDNLFERVQWLETH